MENQTNQVLIYIKEVLGIHADVFPIAPSYLNKLPVYIHETYRLYKTELFNVDIILAEQRIEAEFSIQQTVKHIRLIEDLLQQKVAVVLGSVQAYNRKRLIQKGISFIVPGKQLYLPVVLVDLREIFINPKAKQNKETLLPSAQFLLIYHIINKNEKWKIEEHSFKEIAQKLNYTPMAISNAISNLKNHNLLEVKGEKEKFINFSYDRKELWHIAIKRNLLISPVLKKVFVDEIPKDLYLLQTNVKALPEFTDLNPSKQEYYAIDKTVFYRFKKNNTFVNMNEFEGKYAIEIWKYNPLTLKAGLLKDLPVVDPLSLYLSMKDCNDERVEMALEQIIHKFIL